MSKKIKIILTFSLIFLTSCATGRFKPNGVPRDAAGKSQIVLSGTVVSVKEVIIEGDRDAGTASGAVIGAIVTGSAAKRSERASNALSISCRNLSHWISLMCRRADVGNVCKLLV